MKFHVEIRLKALSTDEINKWFFTDFCLMFTGTYRSEDQNKEIMDYLVDFIIPFFNDDNFEISFYLIKEIFSAASFEKVNLVILNFYNKIVQNAKNFTKKLKKEVCKLLLEGN